MQTKKQKPNCKITWYLSIFFVVVPGDGLGWGGGGEGGSNDILCSFQIQSIPHLQPLNSVYDNDTLIQQGRNRSKFIFWPTEVWKLLTARHWRLHPKLQLIKAVTLLSNSLISLTHYVRHKDFLCQIWTQKNHPRKFNCSQYSYSNHFKGGLVCITLTLQFLFLCRYPA